MSTLLVGVTGKARSGKDTLAKFLVNNHGFKRVAFADALKEVVALIANEPVHLYHDEVHKETLSEALEQTRRWALQAMGVAARESLGPDVWVRRAMRQWRADGCQPTVISDVRFDNEAEAIKQAGGIIVEMVRPGAGLVGAAAKHVSEDGVREELIDIEVFNDGSLYEVAAEARKIARLLTGE
jgi:hypothetical protein